MDLRLFYNAVFSFNFKVEKSATQVRFYSVGLVAAKQQMKCIHTT